MQIGIFNTGVNGTGGFSPTVSANLGSPNINLGPNSSGIVLVGIVDELTERIAPPNSPVTAARSIFSRTTSTLPMR